MSAPLDVLRALGWSGCFHDSDCACSTETIARDAALPDSGAGAVYALLRRTGRVVLFWDQDGLIPGVRALAKADGLVAHQYRYPTPTSNRSQRHQRPYYLSLTDPTSGDLIVAPDAEESVR